MRVMRVILLVLPLTLMLSAAAFAEPSAQPAPMTPQQLEAAIFSPAPISPEDGFSSFYYGVCSSTCEPCWRHEDCPMIGPYLQYCTWACY
jgi:hypothetical protein